MKIQSHTLPPTAQAIPACIKTVLYCNNEQINKVQFTHIYVHVAQKFHGKYT